MDAAATDEVWVEFHSSLEAFESRRFRVEWTATPLPDGRPQPLKGLGPGVQMLSITHHLLGALPCPWPRPWPESWAVLLWAYGTRSSDDGTVYAGPALNGMRLSVEEHEDSILLRNGEAISWRVPRSLDGGLLDSVLVPPLEYLRSRGAPALVL